MRKIKKNRYVIILLIAVLMTGCGNKNDISEEEFLEEELLEEELLEEEILEEELVEGVTSDISKEVTTSIFVHVCGAVNVPGVYEMKAGSRVYEAIEAAEGLSEDALGDRMNQAAFLEDGQQLYVPSVKDAEESYTGDTNESIGESGLNNHKININTASKEELMTLSGIGEAKADAIIRYREQQGGFDTIEEIMEIEGIKAGVFRKIEDQITV